MNFFQNIFQYRKLGLFLFALAFVPTTAYADDDHNGSAVALGWVAIGSGTVANLLFMVFNVLKKLPLLKVGLGSELPKASATIYKPVLNFHIMLNSIGFFAGISHGFLLIRGLDSISLSLSAVMTASMISGIILKFASGRNLKFFGRLVHGQVILSILLVTLVTLHVSTMGGDYD